MKFPKLRRFRNYPRHQEEMKKFVCKSTATPLPLRKVFVVLVIQFSQVFGKKQLNSSFILI